MKNRNQYGSMITFATALLMALVVLGLGFIAFLMYMGGQSETKNAVDSGTLNVGKQALDRVSVNLSLAGNQRIFSDVATNSSFGMPGSISLRNINRVWAKAMLIAINAEDARRLGAAGTGPSNASRAVSGATSISNALSNQLKNQTNLQGFFTAFTSQNSVRMLGSRATVRVLPGAGWQTSLMERSKESNIVLTGRPPSFNLPPNYTLRRSYTTKSTRPNIPRHARNWWFLKGYTPIRIGRRTFWQVPFLYDEKPHLVSRTTFEAAQASARPLGWRNAVPNAFSAQGQAGQRGSVGEKARSWVLTNPRQPFKLAIPQSFIHIQLDQMKAHWYFYPFGPPPLRPIRIGLPSNYNYIARLQSRSSTPGGLGCLRVNSLPTLIGSEVTGRTLDTIIFGPPSGGAGRLESYLVNRINEMITEVGVVKNSNDLHNCLGAAHTVAALAAARGKTHFYIYSPDGKNITCKPKAFAVAEAPWLATMISKSADGTERRFIKKSTSLPVGFTSVKPIPGLVPYFPINIKRAEWNKEVYFEPGTGYNGNLATVRVKRWTNVYSIGVCGPPP